MARFARVVGIAALLCSLAVSANAYAFDRIVILVGGVEKLIYMPPTLAASLGFFRDEGLDVQIESHHAGIEGENQLLAGAAQAVVGFYDHTIELQSKGKGVEAIVVLALAPGSVEMVRSDAAPRIRTMGDLRGGTLGVTALGSSSSLLGQYLAAAQGASSDSYATVPVGTGKSLIAAFAQKRVDVAWTTEPTTSSLRDAGQAQVLVDLSTVDAATLALGGPYPSASLYVQRAWAQAHREEATRLARALVRALYFIHRHTAEEIVARLPSTLYANDRPRYTEALRATLPIYSPDGRMPNEGPANVLRVLGEISPAIRGRQIDLSATFTNEFVDAAQRAVSATR